jgi:uncharacterized Zn-binding protein involved in type VI secretion
MAGGVPITDDLGVGLTTDDAQILVTDITGAIWSGSARFTGAGGLKADAIRIPLQRGSLTTGSPQFTGELAVGSFGPPISIPAGTTAPSSSGSGIAIQASDMAGGQQTGQTLQSFFKVEKLLAVVLGDLVQDHGQDKHGAQPKMAEGLSWFRINGIPVCRQGHHADCGHETTGRNWFHLLG